MTIPVHHDHVGITVMPAMLDGTIAWYSRHFGFVVENRFDAHGTTFVFLVSGDVKIELVAGATSAPTPVDDILTSMDPGRLHHLCLSVDDLDAAVEELRAGGVELIGGPMEAPDIGQRFAFVTDAVGTIIELTGPR